MGPEVLTGSTRLKAGTAQKLVLNMISTASMVGVGKAYQNLMVDVMQTNEKLHRRAEKIVMEATGVDRETAREKITAAGGSVKTAITMILASCDAQEAASRLENQIGGFADLTAPVAGDSGGAAAHLPGVGQSPQHIGGAAAGGDADDQIPLLGGGDRHEQGGRQGPGGYCPPAAQHRPGGGVGHRLPGGRGPGLLYGRGHQRPPGRAGRGGVPPHLRRGAGPDSGLCPP